MKPTTVRDLERRLAEVPAGEPPEDLIDRLAADIPATSVPLSAASGAALRRPPRWLATAAMVVLAVGGGWLLWRLSGQVQPADRGSFGVEEATVVPRSAPAARPGPAETGLDDAAGQPVTDPMTPPPIADRQTIDELEESGSAPPSDAIAPQTRGGGEGSGAVGGVSESRASRARPTATTGQTPVTGRATPPPAPSAGAAATPPGREHLASEAAPRSPRSRARQAASERVPTYARLAITLRVAVLDGDLPWPGSEVLLLTPDGSLHRRIADPNGWATFSGLEPGTHRLVARGIGDTAADSTEIELPEDRSGPVTTELRRPPTGGGVIVEVRAAADGSPLPGATVDIAVGDRRILRTTDGDGLAALRLPPGEHRIDARLAGFEAQVASVEVPTDPDRPTRLRFRLPATAAEAIKVGERLEAAADLPSFDARVTVVSQAPEISTTASSSAAAPIAPPPPGLAIPDPASISVTPEATGGDRGYRSMNFLHAGVHPFVDTVDDRLSTFGLDVDTGSWGLVKGFLERGHLPPTAAVRVEEVVNALAYGDPEPGRGETFRVTTQGAPTPFTADPRDRLLRFAIQARTIDPAERRPAVLTFVVDVSGSMRQGGRLELVQEALGLLLDQLGPADRLAVVAFSDQATVVLPPTADIAAARRAIATLHPQGATNAEAGLALGYRVAWREKRPGHSNRVVLLSDGVANVGATGAESILVRAAGAAADGIELTTIGVGMGNYDDVLLEQLANRGNGRYAYVDDVTAARRIFVEQLVGTLETVAEEARVQVEFDPRTVERWRLLGYENRAIEDHRFRHDHSVDAGEIGAGHTVTALYEVRLAEGVVAGEAGDRRAVAHLTLRHRDPETGRFRETGHRLTTAEMARSWETAPRSLRLAAVAAALAEQLRASPFASGVDPWALAREANAVAADFAGDERAAELASLAARAAELATGPTSRD